MEVEVFYSKDLACPGKRCTDGVRVVGPDTASLTAMLLYEPQCLWGEGSGHIVTYLLTGVLHIANHDFQMLCVEVFFNQ